MGKLSVFAAVLFSFVLAGGVAHAEMIQGSVTAINPTENSFKLNRTDTEQPKEIQVSVNESTQFQGDLNDIESLKVGDEVKVEADKNLLTQDWTAKSLEKGMAGIAGQEGRQGAMGREAGQQQGRQGQQLGQQGQAGEAGQQAGQPGGRASY